jgi:hypothetical protein
MTTRKKHDPLPRAVQKTSANPQHPSIDTAQCLRQLAERADRGELTGVVLVAIRHKKIANSTALAEFHVAGSAVSEPDRAAGLTESFAMLLKEDTLRACGLDF